MAKPKLNTIKQIEAYYSKRLRDAKAEAKKAGAGDPTAAVEKEKRAAIRNLSRRKGYVVGQDVERSRQRREKLAKDRELLKQSKMFTISEGSFFDSAGYASGVVFDLLGVWESEGRKFYGAIVDGLTGRKHEFSSMARYLFALKKLYKYFKEQYEKGGAMMDAENLVAVGPGWGAVKTVFEDTGDDEDDFFD